MKKSTRETEPTYKESKNLMTDFLEEYRGIPSLQRRRSLAPSCHAREECVTRDEPKNVCVGGLGLPCFLLL